MSEVSTKLESLSRFARYFLPAQWTHLLFIVGCLLLYSAAFLSWGPRSESLVTPSGRGELVARNLSLAFPTTLILLASVMGFVASFAKSPERRRLCWKWAWMGATTGIVVVGARLAWTAVLERTATVTAGSALKQFAQDLPHLIVDVGPGFHFVLMGVLCLAAGTVLHKRGVVSLPVGFPLGPKPETQADASLGNLLVFTVLVLGLQGLLGKVWTTIGLLSMSYSDHVLRPGGVFSFLALLQTVAFTAGPALCAFYLAGAAERAELKKLFSLGPIRYYLLALLLPAAVFFLPHLLLELKARIFWTPGRVHFIDLPLSWSLIRIDAWLLLLLPLALLEETGWRGYLQPLAAGCLGLKRGIFLVGLVWGLWHLPSDLSLAESHGGAVHAIVERLAMTVAQSITLAWLILRTRSLLSLAVLHGTWNLLVCVIVPSSLGSLFASWTQVVLWALMGYWLFTRYPLRLERSVESRDLP